METGWYYSSEDSEMDFSQTLSGGYWGSFSSIDNGLPLHCKENGGANSMNLGANQEQMQLYQMNMQTDNKQLAEEEEEEEEEEEDLVYEKSQPSSSLSSEKSSFYFPTPSFDLDPSKAKLTSIPQHNITTMRSHNQNLNPKFSTLERDDFDADAVIMRAMVAVISSTSSSSSPSSPSVLSNPPSQEYLQTTQLQRRGNGKLGAFRRYSRSDLTAKSEAEENCNYGQNMMKRSILMLRKLSSFEGRSSRDSRSTSNQLHHVISERRRREKINTSFEALRMQLPPGTKKDKTSVLVNTRNYVNTLQSQISELKEKNRKLETCLMITDEGKDASHGSNGRAQVQLIKSSSPTSELQQINLRITLRVECDITELVLHILECLKVIRSINLISVDAYTHSPQMNLFAKASIKFGIKDCDWDEALFHEAMTRAVDDVTLNTTTSIISELSHLF